MARSTHTRTNIVAFFSILTLSSVTMLWMLWHFPVKTLLATAAVLVSISLSGMLSRSVETDGLS